MAGTSPAMTKLIKSSHAVIPGWSEGPGPESQRYEESQQLRDSRFAPSARPGMTLRVSSLPLTATIAEAAARPGSDRWDWWGRLRWSNDPRISGCRERGP